MSTTSLILAHFLDFFGVEALDLGWKMTTTTRFVLTTVEYHLTRRQADTTAKEPLSITSSLDHFVVVVLVVVVVVCND